MSIAVQSKPGVPATRIRVPPEPAARIATDGKFLRQAGLPHELESVGERFLVKGVTYGTFAPDSDGYQFPDPQRVSEDFRLMAEFGINTVRTYTPPREDLLDEAARHGLRLMVGLPWSQHVAFLDDRKLARRIRRDIVKQVADLARHPAVLLLALGNEIPPGVVRWHGRVRVENFLRDLYHAAKAQSPESLFTYVNFPPTEFLDLSFFDLCAFNVYLHREPELRAYLCRLQHIAGHKPLLLAEAGADSIREGESGQAEITATHIRAAFEEGACGAIAYAWTDEWWRGGHPVEDWAFGLVDRDRNPKPAAIAVSAAFEDAPFPPEARAAWPHVSVIVCAFNAAATLDDCLESLGKLTYPTYEVILVNDGSRDRTSEIGRGYPFVRVIDTPNRGLSAARNVGLAEATGEIVAYTDADARVDPDWLTFLVQPFLTSDVVGSGGPNVVPDDDPPMAQCIARAPGEPTHVLLDDRTAEHVPGCNMAFRRDALLAIGGFNPVYLRAGDDVDACWRLQARGWKIGFAAAALVWHHHRSSIRAYWKQQIGYGEGETWLMAHHPEKFLDGHMLWRGRIYSPLPFVRSLSGTKINAGVWGSSPFPSVYRTDVHPFAFLPHSIRWQALSFLLTLSGLGVAAVGNHDWAAALLLATGLIGVSSTIVKNLTYAMRSQVHSLPGSKLWYRAAVAYLHFIQPLARAVGRVRGVLSPPEVPLPHPVAQKSGGPRPSVAEAWRAILLLLGTVIEDRFWSETWTSSERVLSQLVDWLRRSRAVRTIEIDEGWSDDRDLSIPVGRWAWIDARALVEDHGDGKSMLRVSTHLRPAMLGVVSALGLGLALFVAAAFGLALRWPAAGAISGAATILIVGAALWHTAQAAAVLKRSLNKVTVEQGMHQMPSGPVRPPIVTPSLLRMYGLRSATIFALMILSLGASTFMLRDAATGPVIGGQKGYAGDYGPAIEAWLDTPGGVVVASNGDVYLADTNNHLVRRIGALNNNIEPVAGNHDAGSGFSGDYAAATAAQLDTPNGVAIAPDGDLVIADSHNNRIRRVDRPTGVIMTIAGSGESGYDGDGRPALMTALNTPSAVAVASSGDIYIADTLNYRVRMIDAKTGLIFTVAGNGKPGDAMEVGDGGPALNATLNMPSDVALDPISGDLYIADMHHNRVRKVDARTHHITTVAGGDWGYSGDDGPATEARLAGPAGVAVVPDPTGKVTVFIADYYNGRVRAVGPDGIIRDMSDDGRLAFTAPSRVAFATNGPRRGWLYVADSGQDTIVPLIIPRIAPNLVQAPPARPSATRRVGG